MMSKEDILNVARPALEGGLADQVSIQPGGEVYVYCTFTTHNDEEPHDAAWDRYSAISEALEAVGLRVDDYWSDNDSLGGHVRERVP